MDEIKKTLEEHTKKIHKHDTYLTVAAIIITFFGISGTVLISKYQEASSALAAITLRADELEKNMATNKDNLTKYAEALRADMDKFARAKVSSYANPAISPVTSKNGCALWGDLQMCWGAEDLTRPAKNPHVRTFSFKYEKPFTGTPSITTGIHSNYSKTGDAFAVYSYVLTNQSYTGAVIELDKESSPSPVVMHYMAIGKKGK